MAAAPRRAWTTAVAVAIAVHVLLVLVPVMDEREGTAATPPVVRVRLTATRTAPAAELPSASPDLTPTEPVRAAHAEPIAATHAATSSPATAVTTEPVEPIPPTPRRSEPQAPAPLPDGLIGEPPRGPTHDRGDEAGAAEALDAYATGVRREVEAQKHYPRRARRMRRQGIADVDVTLTREGALAASPALAHSSGWEALDREALRMVRAAAPFPPLPAAIVVPRITIRLPIRFFLD